jgi:NADPH-dependent curcumin reductase CurA
MAGFVVADYAAQIPAAIGELAGWVSDGRLQSIEDTETSELKMFPSLLARLFEGQNTGKLALELNR